MTNMGYPPVMTNIAMERSTIFNRKIHYFYGHFQWLCLITFFGDFGRHLQIFAGDYIPDTWVMFKLDIYQPLNQGKYMVNGLDTVDISLYVWSNIGEIQGKYMVFKICGNIFGKYGKLLGILNVNGNITIVFNCFLILSIGTIGLDIVQITIWQNI